MSSFQPGHYAYQFAGTEMIYRFNTYKVQQQNEQQLEQSNKPFALAILTVLLALKKNKPDDAAAPENQPGKAVVCQRVCKANHQQSAGLYLLYEFFFKLHGIELTKMVICNHIFSGHYGKTCFSCLQPSIIYFLPNIKTTK